VQDSEAQDRGSEALDPVQPNIDIKIRHRSLIAISEGNAVSRQREKLLLDAVEDMVTSSTNPLVSDIALQSLAGLPTSISPAIVPEHLWTRIKSTLESWFPYFSEREFSEHQNGVAERLSRALFHLPPPYLESNLLVERVVRRLPHNPRTMALEGAFLNRSDLLNVESLMEKVLKHPPIETRTLHPEIHLHILQGMNALSNWYPPKGDSKRILSFFASHLSSEKSPTLQEEIMFHRLYRSLQLQESSKLTCNVREYMNFLMLFDYSLLIQWITDGLPIPFIEVLPMVAEYFLSAGADPCDLLFKMLLKMLCGDVLSLLSSPIYIYGSYWDESLIYLSDPHNKDRRQALLDVLHQLLGAENGGDQCCQWEGSISLRLRVIIHLYYCLGEQECHTSVWEAMLCCYPLLVNSWSDGSEDEVPDQEFLNDSQKYFLKLFQESPPTFQEFCSSFTSKHISSLPNAALACIKSQFTTANKMGDMGEGAKGSMEEDGVGVGLKITEGTGVGLDTDKIIPEKAKYTAAGLDEIFQHFLLSEDLDSTFPMGEGQYHTLSNLIALVSNSLADHTSNPCWWTLSYSWLDLMEQQLAKLSATQYDIQVIHTGHGYVEGHHNTADEIGEHSVRLANDTYIIVRERLHELANMVRGVLDQYPLPLPPSRSSKSTAE
jgi:hypothetical protein